ncbi:Hypothetical_protein [Hexamita inflata]|uniref:Hypothetical_protein n=1 Tax=Hexamita inflata TaxID=28002 RepID=A0AA86TKX2_9EUKA|nr:Hypothetical protein HINF_LOCUS9344 [Hexamita inflata]CAI9921700.1 Hypothetical protein HINF_LOCUS9345 [Hexamita inflata]
MENSSSFALEQTYQHTVDMSKLAHGTARMLSEEQAEVHTNRHKWCAVAWTSIVLAVLSGISVYVMLQNMEDYYDAYQCLGLSLLFLLLVLSLVGVMFSARACLKMQSVIDIVAPCCGRDGSA